MLESLSQRQFTMCKLQELDRWLFRRSNFLRCEAPLARNRIMVWSLLGYLFGTYAYFGVHQFDNVLHILPVVIDVAHAGVSRVQAGKTTGDSAPEGICWAVERGGDLELSCSRARCLHQITLLLTSSLVSAALILSDTCTLILTTSIYPCWC